jgi:hypothetical protein
MVIIVICVLSEIGIYINEDENPILTKQHLRGISTISNLWHIDNIIYARYNKIYNYVIGSAANGETSAGFTIMCICTQYNNCDNYDGYQEWWTRYIYKNGGEFIPKNDIRSEQIKRRVIQKIQTAFPDSNITKGYENCCDTYNITW